MKHLISIACIIMHICVLPAQQSYTWNVSTGSWADPLSWLPERLNPAPDDILHFTNNATVTNLPVAESIGKLNISGNGTIQISSTIISNLQIGHANVTAPHFAIASTAALNITGTNAVHLSIQGGFAGEVVGKLSLGGGTHQLTAAGAGSLLFRSGAVFTAATGFSGNAFGASNLNSVVFENGATYIFTAGSAPFGAAAPATVTVLDAGSIYIHRANTPPPSFAGRTYGHFYIDGNVNFAGIGSSRDCVIKNDLRLLSGFFSFKPNAINAQTGSFFIHGNIICEGNTWIDIGNNNMTGAVHLAGQNQFVGSGGGSGGITITNLVCNNLSSTLERPVLITAGLSLQQGFIKTTTSAPLILGAAASIQSCTHSYSNLPYNNMGCNNAYIEGPIEKRGLNNQSFAFPTGINGVLRPIILHNATGNFVATYIRGNPQTEVSQTMAASIHHISGLEYWQLNGSGSAKVELSFMDPNSGGVTDMNALKAARFDGTSWRDADTETYLGSAGANGSVSSTLLSSFGYFSLAGATGYPNNPLPDKTYWWDVTAEKQGAKISWRVLNDQWFQAYVIEKSGNGIHFEPITLPVVSQQNSEFAYVHFTAAHPGESAFYRLKMIDYQNNTTFSDIKQLHYPLWGSLQVTPNPAAEKIFINIPASSSISELVIVNISGLVQKRIPIANQNTVSIDISTLSSGVYYLKAISTQAITVVRFLKF